MDLPEPVAVMILLRLPIKDMARMKSVCRQWKSLLESKYFNDLYRTIIMKTLTSSWSILYRDQLSNTVNEFFCERLEFKQSIGSDVSSFLNLMQKDNKGRRNRALAITEGLILLDVSHHKLEHESSFCVVNPLLRQWIKIPETPYVPRNEFQGATLVTQMKKNGELLGYKVVRYGSHGEIVIPMQRSHLCFQIYSSDSGLWTNHYVSTQRPIYKHLPTNPINLNGYLHWLCRADQVIFAHDFYSQIELCYVIDLPQRSAKGSYKSPRQGDQETLTISCGSLVYMHTDTGKPNQQLKIWRLKNYTSGSCSKTSWDLLWNLRPGLDLGLACNPVAMHPFDKEIVYLVTRQTNFLQTHAYLVSGNLRTKRFQLNKDWKQKTKEFGEYKSLHFHQFVLPQRQASIPCPPGCTLVTLPQRPFA